MLPTFLVGIAVLKAVAAQTDILQFVNPLIGTNNGGHVFAGATLPFGMAKAVADVNGENQGGFATDGSNVTGFSHMHDSGTGGSPSLGNFPLFPQAGCVGDQIDGCIFPQTDRATPYINSSVIAEPGYFSIELNTSIRAEMTVTNHTALYRFTFPATPTTPNTPLSPVILVDLIDLPQSRMNASVAVNPTTGRMTGSGTFNPSFGIGTYDLHFCADFTGATIRDTGVFLNNRAGNEPKQLSVQPDGTDTGSQLLPAGAWVWFHAPSGNNNEILARVGVSFISEAQACNNAETEIPTFGFHDVRTSATQAWRDKLSVVSIEAGGVNRALQTTFWSGIYRAMISPQDYTGENPLWVSSEPYYDSYYCIWDSFRSIHPLITLLDQESQSRMVRSLVDIYRHEGWLPDCRMSLCKGFTQGGSNADNVLADSYLKNISMGVDWQTAFAAVIQDAEVEPPVWGVNGRGGLTSWKTLDYIPTDDYDPYGVGPFTRSISRTVEYAYNDFCIASMALAMGNTSAYNKYSARASNWKNMYSPSTTSLGFTGFLQPRYLNGTYGFQDPAFCSPLLNFTACYLNPDGHETYEGSAWLYTFFAPGDMAALVALLGGADDFVARLNYFHDSGLLYIGDEQAFLPVYLYHYAGRPGLSANRSHAYIPAQFNDTAAGLAGNDDSGAMGSFVALSMLGLFPVPGQNVYLITPPYFASVNVTNRQTGATATVTNRNFELVNGGAGADGGQGQGYKNIYIQSATLNGVAYTKNWIDHSFFLEGGVLELVLGDVESAWGTAEADLPPSLSTTGIHL